MNEQQLQRNIIHYLKSEDFYVVKVVQASKRGVPDIIACSPDGRFIAIEVKAPGKLSGVTPLQDFNLAEIRRHGGIAMAADSLLDVKALLH
jgi:hypothetical protein